MRQGLFFWETLAATAIGCVLLALSFSGCSPSDDTAKRVLRGAGYQHVMLRGYPWMACSDDDNFNVAFSAISPSGSVVTGAVCCGWLKSCTVRVDP